MDGAADAALAVDLYPSGVARGEKLVAPVESRILLGERVARECRVAAPGYRDVFEIQPVDRAFLQRLDVRTSARAGHTVAVPDHPGQRHVLHRDVSEHRGGSFVGRRPGAMKTRERDCTAHTVPVYVVVHYVFDVPAAPALGLKVGAPGVRARLRAAAIPRVGVGTRRRSVVADVAISHISAGKPVRQRSCHGNGIGTYGTKG